MKFFQKNSDIFLLLSQLSAIIFRQYVNGGIQLCLKYALFAVKDNKAETK